MYLEQAHIGDNLLGFFDATKMVLERHGDSAVDAGVCIERLVHAALARLLRYCARPSVVMNW